MRKLVQKAKGDLAINLARTFIARAVAALGSLLLLLVVGRHYGASGVGVLAIAQSLFLGGGLLAKGGMDGALMRYVGQDPHAPQVEQYFWWCFKPVILISFTLALLLILCSGGLQGLFGSQGLAHLLLGMSLAIPGFAIAYLLSGFFKGARMPATACLLQNGAVNLITGLLIALAVALGVATSNITYVGVAFFVASLVVCLFGVIQFVQWRKQLPKPKVDSQERRLATRAQFFTTSNAFFVTSIASFIQSVLAVLLAGWMLNDEDLGLFKAAQQVGMLIAFILLVINAIFPPKFASLYKQQQMDGLAKIARLGALVGCVFVAPLVAVCTLAPQWVLGWFGPEFTSAALLLQIIAIGQLVNVATGSVGFLLNMTNHEKLMRNIALVCNVLGLVGFFVFIKLFGVLGAAIALAFVLVSQNVAALVCVWVKLGIWTLPTPNILSWLRVPTQAPLPR